MTRINLLPPEKVKVKRRKVSAGRSYLWLIIVLPLIVAVAMGFWFFQVSGQISKKDEALKQSQAELADWQAKTADLQQYKVRQDEINMIEAVVIQALGGRVYWARVLNEIAIMCPTDIWLVSLSGTSVQGQSGSVAFQGYALQCPNRTVESRFYPYLPDYRPIAGWLEKMAQIIEFERVWLSNANPTTIGATHEFIVVLPDGTTSILDIGTWVISFSSQATLDMKTATVGPLPVATPAAPVAPASTAPEGGGAR